jgi:hypothetical protein
MSGASAADDGRDADRLDLLAVPVVVVGAVGEHRFRSVPGRPRRPRTGGIAWMSGMSWATSLRMPPVSDTCSGMPCPSVIRWCFEPVRARSTGARPCFAPPFIARKREPSITALDQSSWPAAFNSASRLSCNRRQTPPCSSPRAVASRSYPTRNPALAAGTPTESRCRGRIGCRTAPCGHLIEDDRDDHYAEAQRSATAARPAPIGRRTSSTVAAAPASRS